MNEDKNKINVEKFLKFLNENDEDIKETLKKMNEHGIMYRTMRSFLSILQVLPPINFMSAYYDDIFSDLLNEKFYGTSIISYSVKTQHYGNIWSVPMGAPKSSRRIYQSIPFYNIIYWYKIYLEQQATRDSVQRGISFIENKISINGLPNVTLYRSEKQKEFLELDEQIALSLFEISKNCLLFDYLIMTKVNKILAILEFFGILGLGLTSASGPNQYIIVSMIIVLLISVAAIYNNRRLVYDTDNIVVKMGYGDQLSSALEKINKFNTGGSMKMSGMFLPEQLINIIDMFYYNIMKLLNFLKLSFTPYYKNRIDNIEKEKNKTYKDVKLDETSYFDFILFEDSEETNNIDITNKILNMIDSFGEKLINSYISPNI